MENKDLNDALAVIYDPVRGNMLTTRSILHGMGFRRIDGIISTEPFLQRLKDIDVAVIFIECTENTEYLARLIQEIRLGETKANPFLPIIATLWYGEGKIVADLMNAGCDDVLLRPFSVNKVQERIKAIIDHRKKFVVTSDYIGPDRGKPALGRVNVQPFEVPNPLKDIVEKGNDAVKRREFIENAKKRVNKERLAKLARRIAMAAEVTIHADTGANVNKGFVVDLLETSFELVKIAKRMGQDDILDIASVMENVVTKTANGSQCAENAQLTRQLALAIYVAYAAEDGEAFKKELKEVLRIVRERLKNAKDREQRVKNMVEKVAKTDGHDRDLFGFSFTA